MPPPVPARELSGRAFTRGIQHDGWVVLTMQQNAQTLHKIDDTGHFHSPLNGIHSIPPHQLHCYSDGGYIREANRGSSSWIVSVGPDDGRVVVACGVIHLDTLPTADVNYYELYGTDLITSLMQAFHFPRGTKYYGDNEPVMKAHNGQQSVLNLNVGDAPDMFKRIFNRSDGNTTQIPVHVLRERNKDADALAKLGLSDAATVFGTRAYEGLQFHRKTNAPKPARTKRRDLLQQCGIPGCEFRFVSERADDRIQEYQTHLYEIHYPDTGADTPALASIPSSRADERDACAPLIHCTRCFRVYKSLSGHKTTCATESGSYSPRSSHGPTSFTNSGHPQVPDHYGQPRVDRLTNFLRDEDIVKCLDSVSFEQLYMSQHPVLQFIPGGTHLERMWADTLLAITDHMNSISITDVDSSTFMDRGLKMIILMHSAVLQRPREGETIRSCVHKRLNLVLTGQWQPIVDLISPVIGHRSRSQNTTMSPDVLFHSKLKRATTLACEGFAARSLRTLESMQDLSPPPPITDVQWTTLAKETFPAPYTGPLTWDPTAPDVVDARNKAIPALLDRLSQVRWHKIVHAVSVTTAVDGSHAYPKHFRVWVRAHPTSFKRIMIWMATGRLTPEAAGWCFGSRLVFIPKPDKIRFRPISVAGMLAKVLSNALAAVHKEAFKCALVPLGQLAVGVPGGADIFANGTRALMAASQLQATGTQVFRLQADLEGGFTRMSRRAVFDALVSDSRFHGLIPMFVAQYSLPVAQYSPETSSVFYAAEGLLQGDGLSPGYFCLASSPVLAGAAQVTQVAWLDCKGVHPTRFVPPVSDFSPAQFSSPQGSLSPLPLHQVAQSPPTTQNMSQPIIQIDGVDDEDGSDDVITIEPTMASAIEPMQGSSALPGPQVPKPLPSHEQLVVCQKALGCLLSRGRTPLRDTVTDLLSFMDDYNFYSFLLDYLRFLLDYVTSAEFASAYPHIAFSLKKWALHATEFTQSDYHLLLSMRSTIVCDEVRDDSPGTTLPAVSMLKLASTRPPPPDFPFPCARGLITVGCPIGDMEWELSQVTEIVDKAISRLETVLLVDSAMLAQGLLRICFVPALNYLLRTSRLETTRSIVGRWDDALMATAKRINHISFMECTFTGSLPNKQMRLPCKYAGMGLTSAADTVAHARLGSIVDSFRYAKATCVGNRFVFGLYPLLHAWVWEGAAHHFLDDFKDLWAATADARTPLLQKQPVPFRPNGHLVSVPAFPMDVFGVDTKLQHKLCHAAADVEYKRMTAPPPTSDKLACMMRATLISGAQKGGRGFWMTMPSDHELTLSNEEFYIYVRLRLSLLFTTTDLGRDCSRCSSHFHTSMERIAHLSVCKGGTYGGTTLIDRHDAVRSTLLDFITSAAILADPKEPRGQMYDSRTDDLYQGGTDIAAFGAVHEGDEWQFDVHIISATHNSSALTPNSLPLSAAAAGERKKYDEYSKLCTDNHVQFLPIVVEIEGAFAAGTLRLINILRRRIHDRANLVRGFADHDDVTHFDVQYWVQRLTISIARQVARHILDGIAAAHGMVSHAGRLHAGLTNSFWPSADAVSRLGSDDF